MAKVFAMLAGWSVISFCTIALPPRHWSVGPGLAMLCFVGSMFYITITGEKFGYSGEVLSVKRMGASGLLAFAYGLLMRASLLDIFAHNPEIITTALFATIVIFACFSLASLFMTSRAALYVCGLTSSLTLYISMVRFTNLLVRSRFANNFTDVALLVSFCGYIIMDTQIILQEFSRGSKDFLWHAVTLYGDLLSIFLKIVQILCAKEKRRQKEKIKTESRVWM